MSAPLRERGCIQEGPNLLADGTVLSRSQRILATVPEGLASERDFQRLPGLVVRSLKGFRELLAVVGKPLGKGVDKRVCGSAETDGAAGRANQLTQRHDGQALEDAHAQG